MRRRSCVVCGSTRVRTAGVLNNGLLLTLLLECEICGRVDQQINRAPRLSRRKPYMPDHQAQPENQGEQSGRIPLEQPAHDATD